MSYRNERFNRRMMSLEVMVAGFADASKARVFSDRGIGVRRMIAALDYDLMRECAAEEAAVRSREEKLFEAEMRLADAEKSHLIPVLLLIVENGKDRGRSIDKLTATSKTRNAARKKYFEHRDALLDFFQK